MLPAHALGVLLFLIFPPLHQSLAQEGAPPIPDAGPVTTAEESLNDPTIQKAKGFADKLSAIHADFTGLQQSLPESMRNALPPEDSFWISKMAESWGISMDGFFPSRGLTDPPLITITDEDKVSGKPKDGKPPSQHPPAWAKQAAPKLQEQLKRASALLKKNAVVIASIEREIRSMDSETAGNNALQIDEELNVLENVGKSSHGIKRALDLLIEGVDSLPSKVAIAKEHEQFRSRLLSVRGTAIALEDTIRRVSRSREHSLARFLQDVGFPPQVVGTSPKDDSQKVISLYRFPESDKPSLTPAGKKLVRMLAQEPAAAHKMTREKLSYLSLLFGALEDSKRMDPVKERVIWGKIWEAARQTPDSSETPLRLGRDPPLSEKLEAMRTHYAQRSSLLNRPGLPPPPSPISDTIPGDRLRGAGDALETLTFHGLKPLTTPQLAQLIRDIPAGELTDRQWEVLIKSFPMGESLWRMRVDRLWRKGFTGKGIKVAVIDHGLDSEHPDIKGAVVEERNFSAEKQDMRFADRKQNESDSILKGEHGTHVASTIRAIAPDVQFLNFSIKDNSYGETNSDFFDKLNKALDQAIASGAHIVNISMGIPYRSKEDVDPSDPISRQLYSIRGMLDKYETRQADKQNELYDKIKQAADKGILVVIAAGNERREGSLSAHESLFHSIEHKDELQQGLRTPGHLEEALTVGAADFDGHLAEFSSYGEIAIPKERRLYDKPDIIAYGVDIEAAYAPSKRRDLTYFFGVMEPPQDHGGLHARKSGTSMAAPHVSGAAALLLDASRQMGMQLQPRDVKVLLMVTAQKVREHLYIGAGAGLLDIQKAVETLPTWLPPESKAQARKIDSDAQTVKNF